MTTNKCFNNYRSLLNRALDSINQFDIDLLTTAMLDAYDKNIAILVCGNGGSAAISEHLSCDHTKGIRTDTNLSSNIISLSSNLPLITAIANDISYDQIYSKQVEWFQGQGSLLVISSSGKSPNVVNALRAAKKKNMYTMAMVGFDGGTILKENLADALVHVNTHNYGIVEDCHQIIMHSIAQQIRKNYSTNKNSLVL